MFVECFVLKSNLVKISQESKNSADASRLNGNLSLLSPTVQVGLDNKLCFPKPAVIFCS